MSSLTWLMYAADVAGSISAVGSFVAVVSGIGGGLAMAFTAADDRGSGEALKAGKPFLQVALFAAAVASVVPSKVTIYAIAAEQVGEKALATETGDKAVKALNAWLDRQIAGKDEK